MKRYNYFLFDLDGTVLDTLELIIRTFKNTAMKYRSINAYKDDISRVQGVKATAAAYSYGVRKPKRFLGRVFNLYSSIATS